MLLAYDGSLTDAERAFLTLLAAFRKPVDNESDVFDRVFRAAVDGASNGALIVLDDAGLASVIRHLLGLQLIRYDAPARQYSMHALIRVHYLLRLDALEPEQTRAFYRSIAGYYLHKSKSLGRAIKPLRGQGYSTRDLAADVAGYVIRNPLRIAVHDLASAKQHLRERRWRKAIGKGALFYFGDISLFFFMPLIRDRHLAEAAYYSRIAGMPLEGFGGGIGERVLLRAADVAARINPVTAKLVPGGSVSAPTRTCRRCGEPAKSQSSECVACGEPFQLDERRCRACGGGLRRGDNFCSQCGQPLD